MLAFILEQEEVLGSWKGILLCMYGLEWVSCSFIQSVQMEWGILEVEWIENIPSPLNNSLVNFGLWSPFNTTGKE